MTLLVTGGAGFIGSHFIKLWLATHPNEQVVNFDALTYAGNLANVATVQHQANYTFIKGDVRDIAAVRAVFEEYAITQVVNFAAESHVDRSIAAPHLFMETNVLGTENLLNVARQYWEVAPQTYRPHTRFVQISTDEVYGDAQNERAGFIEDSPLLPSSPYAAAKASADLLIGAYQRTYRFPALITRCTNNYGPNQYAEKWIPVVIKHALNDTPIPVYGSGLQERNWIHVEDHCRAVRLVLEQGQVGQIYNISGTTPRTNVAIATDILQLLGKSPALLTHVTDRLGHDQAYRLQMTRMQALHWQPTIPFDEGLRNTVAWYQAHPDYLEG